MYVLLTTATVFSRLHGAESSRQVNAVLLASQWRATKHHRQRYSTTEIPALQQHQAEPGNQLRHHKREALARHRQRYRPTQLHSSHPSSPQRRGMNGARATTIACKRRYWHWWAGLSVATPQTLSFCGSSAPFDVTDDRNVRSAAIGR